MFLTSYFSCPILSSCVKSEKIAISRSQPKDFKGRVYIDLAPDWELIRLKDNQEKYTEIYNELLKTLDPFKVLKDLDNSVVLCWESPKKFCHRHLVADWIMKETNINIYELSHDNILLIEDSDLCWI